MSGVSTYRPGNVKDSELRNELNKIVQAANASDPLIWYKTLGAAPDKNFAGETRFADGTNWNPGYGSGLYLRNSSNLAWRKLDGHPIYHVEDFGAVGDGVTDDYAAIMRAVSAAYANGGGRVYFACKRYAVATSVVVPQRVWLVGDAPAFINQFVTGSVAPRGAAIFLKTGANTSPVVFRCRLTNVAGVLTEEIHGDRNSEARHFGGAINMTFWGNRSTNQSPTITDLNSSGSAVRIEGSRYITLHHCTMMFAAVDGVEMASFNYGTGALSSNNCWLNHANAHSNGRNGLNLAGGDNVIDVPNTGFNGGSGIQVIGSGTITGGLCWNNLAHGFSSLSMAVTGSLVVTGLHSYDNESIGFRIGTGRAPNLIGCVARGNGRDTLGAGLSAANRSNFLISSGAEGWSLASCYSYGIDQTGAVTAQVGYTITNTVYSGTIDGCTDDQSVTAFSISDKTKIISHGAVEGITHPGVVFSGTVDFDSHVLNNIGMLRMGNWTTVAVTAGAVTVSGSGWLSLNEAAPTNVTDLTFSGSSGLPVVTIRNLSANAITFVHNTAKLRLNSGANIVISQHQAIEFTYVSGTVWQHTGGKQT